MPIISIEKLNNANLDAETIEQVVNGEPNVLVESREGRKIPTLATLGEKHFSAGVILYGEKTQEQVNDEMGSALTALHIANKYYSTLAAAKADIANIAVNEAIWIGDEATGGLYEKETADATSLTKSAYDPLTQAKADATLKANAARAMAIDYINSLALDLNEDTISAVLDAKIGDLAAIAAGQWPDLLIQTEDGKTQRLVNRQVRNQRGSLEYPIVFDNFQRLNSQLINAESGQSYSFSGDSPAVFFQIVDNCLVMGGDIDSTGNSYLHVNGGSQLLSISCEFEFVAHGEQRSVLAVVLQGNDNAGLANLLHAVLYRDAYVLQVRVGGAENGLIQILGGGYDECKAGVKYKFSMTANPDTNEAWVSLPDGSSAYVKDSRITSQIIGRNAYWQIIRNTTNHDKIRIHSISAHGKAKKDGLIVKPDVFDAIKAVEKNKVQINKEKLSYDSVTFTPNAVGWYRIWSETGIKKFAGSVTISVPWSEANYVTDAQLELSVSTFSSANNMTINQLRNCHFNQAVTKARVGNNASNTLYFDIYVAQTGVPITVKIVDSLGLTGTYKLSNKTPTLTTDTPVRVKELQLGNGLRSANTVYAENFKRKAATITSTVAFSDDYNLHFVDASAGNVTINLPLATTESGGYVKEHTFIRVDNTANTVSVIGYFLDGSTTKTIAARTKLEVIATGFEAIPRWFVL